MTTRKQLEAAAAEKKAAAAKVAAEKKAAAAKVAGSTERRALDPRQASDAAAPPASADSPSPDSLVAGVPKTTIVGKLADDSDPADIAAAAAAEVQATAHNKNPETDLLNRRDTHRHHRNAEMVEVTVARAFKFTDDTHVLVDYAAGTYEVPRQVAEDSFAIAQGGITLGKPK